MKLSAKNERKKFQKFVLRLFILISSNPAPRHDWNLYIYIFLCHKLSLLFSYSTLRFNHHYLIENRKFFNKSLHKKISSLFLSVLNERSMTWLILQSKYLINLWFVKWSFELRMREILMKWNTARNCYLNCINL